MADATRKPRKQASGQQKAKKPRKKQSPRPGRRTKGGGQKPPRSDKELAKEAIRRKKAEMEAEETGQEAPPEAPEAVEAEPVDGTLEQVLEQQSPGEQELLEDMALEFWLRTRSLAMTADLMNRPKSTVHDYVTRARQRRRSEVMSSDLAQTVADVLSEWEFVQKMAMEEFLSAPMGSFQRNGFLHTYMQAIGRKEHTLRQAALLPRAPKEVDFDFGQKRQEQASLATAMQQAAEKDGKKVDGVRLMLHGLLKKLRAGSGPQILGGGEG